MLAQHGNAKRQRVVDRQVGHPLHAAQSVIADFEREFAAERVLRLAADNVYCTRGGVATVQGPLGPPQDFDPGDVEECRACLVGAPQIHTVEVEGCGRISAFGRIVAADAADVDIRVASVSGADLHIGYDIGQVGSVCNAAFFEFSRGQCSQSNWRTRCGFRPFLGRDDHFLNDFLLGSMSHICRQGRNESGDHFRPGPMLGSIHVCLLYWIVFVSSALPMPVFALLNLAAAQHAGTIPWVLSTSISSGRTVLA